MINQYNFQTAHVLGREAKKPTINAQDLQEDWADKGLVEHCSFFSITYSVYMEELSEGNLSCLAKSQRLMSAVQHLDKPESFDWISINMS